VSTHWTERLSEYLDDELTSSERAACEAHLSNCAACRGALRELEAVVAFARTDEDRVPATDLWPDILQRIAVERPDHSTARRVRPLQARTTEPRRVAFTWPQLALAASLLVAVSAGVAYVAAGRALSPGAASETPIQAQVEPLLPTTGSVERANFADAQFDQAIADLEQVLVDRREQLDPRTVLIIERNLAAIDQAIREAREALDGDPANTFLNSHLADARRKKLELLRQATMLESPSGD
jgi:negative regulator of sigma E activity